MSAAKYDLVVIGSGPSGQRAAVAASKMKKRVAVVESRAVVGGVCVNTGTIPSKTLRESALMISGLRQRELYGLDFRGLKDRVTVRDFLARERLVKETERERIQENLRRHHVTLFAGAART